MCGVEQEPSQNRAAQESSATCFKFSARAACAGLLALGLMMNSVSATEGASGRPVAGAAVNPAAAVVPQGPQWIANFGVQAVDGRMGAARNVPIAGRIAAQAKNQYMVESFTLMKVWDTGDGPWHLASAATLPVMQTRVDVSAYSPSVPSLALSDKAAGLFDMAITPIIAGYRMSPDEHLSLALRVWVPTGRYEPGQLANLSHNVWTIIPTVSYTRFMPGGWEASGVATVNFSTRNSASDYKNAPLFTLDILGTRKIAEAWSAGGVVGWIRQIGDDKGPLADRLNGFQGRELSMGPIVTYNTKLGSQPLSSSLRWLSTVSQHNRFDRNMVYFSLSMPL